MAAKLKWLLPMKGCYTLTVHNGLYYMDMQPASDSDLTTYPDVFITADSPWNPDIVDEEFFLDSLDSSSDYL